MNGLTEIQLQELQNCKGECEECSIRELRGGKPCFDFIVNELIMAKTEHKNAKNYIKDLEDNTDWKE